MRFSDTDQSISTADMRQREASSNPDGQGTHPSQRAGESHAADVLPVGWYENCQKAGAPPSTAFPAGRLLKSYGPHAGGVQGTVSEA